jgi:hypothetical protein
MWSEGEMYREKHQKSIGGLGIGMEEKVKKRIGIILCRSYFLLFILFL